MNAQRCSCPGCSCSLGATAVYREGHAYCCQACADGHPDGEKRCQDTHCHCGEQKPPRG
ncbi:metallothionein [Pseudomonas sp. LABIM340]|uniref:Metallothionein n=1 Tax=Pseudomonas nitroreducens TaxID=46680 RepID=A0A5R9A3U0_PSENT|nr:metallothionein [Pseudomonas nitroreducens]TLP73353.1 metallothionein [Pseudomonas nitroreducens]